ncbi:MAG TPA: S41 family peptidase [Chloroflexota bacterium]|nr:S41 family peptidase [Chloroflexota bacterium]
MTVGALGIALSLLVGFGGGIAFDRYVLLRGTPPTEPQTAQSTFGVFWEAWRLVEDHYVDRASVDPKTMTYGAIEGMLDSLQDTGHTRFLSPSDVKSESQSLAGQLEGVGIEVETRDGRLTVVAPLDGSPAKQAGLMPGDVIEKVNGQDVSQMSLEQVSGLIRGPSGTSVHLTILRPGASELLEFTIVRQEVKVPLVTWGTVPGQHIADIRISEFGNNTDSQLRTALAAATAAGDTQIILDLRNDPGGLLDQAVKVSSEFVKSGDVLMEQDRSGLRRHVAIEPGGAATSTPLVVLVNHGTASGAEIVAGALQDHRRAEIVGEQTFGTGTVLNEYPLSDGSAILLGVREWLTPDGHVIWKNGITPNDVVAQSASTVPIAPTELQPMTPDQLQKRGDTQLLDAVKILGGKTQTQITLHVFSSATAGPVSPSLRHAG